MSEVTFKISGAKEVQKVLDSLPDRIQRQALRNGLAAGARIIRDEARRLAPRGLTGNLRKRIKVKRRRGTRDLSRVTVRSEAPHSHLIEKGTQPRTQKTTGRFTGAVTPKPFMRPAFDGKQKEVVRAVFTRVQSFIRTKVKR